MNNNVYSPPNADLLDNAALNKPEAEKTLVIAKRQKHLLYCFLVYLILSLFLGISPEAIQPVIQLLAIPLLIAIVVFTARLSLRVYSITVAIIMIILSVVPLFNILIILAASSRATKAIKSAGFNVGFMGANIKTMEAAIKK